MIMDTSKKHEPKMTFQGANTTMETHPTTRAGCTVPELLEDSGNCRQMVNQELSLHLLSDSLFSEQQKLRHVLDWAHSFLSNDSEVHHEFCRAESLILANKEQRKTQKRSPVSAAKYHHRVSCITDGDEVFGGGGSIEKVCHLEPLNYENSGSNKHLCTYNVSSSDDPCIPFSFRDEITWPEYRKTLENMKIMNLQDATNNSRTSSLYQSTYSLSGRNTNQTLASDGETGFITESTSCWGKKSTMFGTVSNLKLNSGVHSERDKSGLQMELRKVKVEGKVGTKKEAVRMGERKGDVTEDQDSEKPQKKKKQMEKTSNLRFSHHLKIPPSLTVYEQYQLCADHLRIRHSQHIEPGCFIDLLAKERQTSEEMPAPPPTSGFELNSSTTNPEIKTHLNKRVTAAEITEERSSDVINKNQDRSKHNRSRATFTEQGQTEHCDNLTPAAIWAESQPVCQRNNITRKTHLDHDTNKCGELIIGTAANRTSTDKLINRRLRTSPGDNVEETAAITPNRGLFPKKTGCDPGVKTRVKGQKKKAGGKGASLRLCEKSRVSLSSLTNKEILQRAQSSGEIKHTKRHTPEDRGKPTSAQRDTHKFQTQTPLHDNPGPASPTSGTHQCEQTDCKHSPAGVPVCDCWLCLPDEVWLSILSLLSHSDLCRVLQVCSRLHTLATDHTLWKDLRIEKCTLTEPWLLCVSRRRPRSLSLYSCCGTSLTSCGLEMFFTLCGKSLEELKVISCIGPGLHGDQMLPLIGQLCDHVTSVDVSWSGATDKGVRALSDCCTGMQLKSVVLNGCHVTDDPLMKLVRRHKESLSRLEVFGCQFLTPSCLQTVYEVCPGLKHLNIGQVPKVSAHSLTVMISHLKRLISLNLTGLQAVTDATMDALLQNCVRLQSLTISSCPGVTDLTLHSISRYTPYIRSLDVSGCKAVTDAGVQALALGCRRLQQLDLSSSGTGNRGVTLLANYCSGHLSTVKLSFCHVTLESILKLCRRCKRLNVLHLYGCSHLPTERQIREVNAAVKVYPLP